MDHEGFSHPQHMSTSHLAFVCRDLLQLSHTHQLEVEEYKPIYMFDINEVELRKLSLVVLTEKLADQLLKKSLN